MANECKLSSILDKNPTPELSPNQLIHDIALSDLPSSIVDIGSDEAIAIFATCTTAETERFKTGLYSTASLLMPGRFSFQLHSLFGRAYTSNPQTHETTVTDPLAKKELELNLNLMDLVFSIATEQSFDYSPAAFSAAILFSALNSNDITPTDRFYALEDIQNPSSTPQTVEESYKRFLDEIRNLDFSDQKSIENYFKSGNLFYLSGKLSFGETKLIADAKKYFPKEFIEKELAKEGRLAHYQELSTLTTDQLFARSSDLGLINLKEITNPALIKNINWENILINFILTSRGENFTELSRKKSIEQYQEFFGLDEKSGQIMNVVTEAAETPLKADNYQSKALLLKVFFQKYAEFLKVPTAQKYTEETMAQMNLFRSLLLNPTYGAELKLADIDWLRKTVNEKNPPKTDRITSFADIKKAKGNLFVKTADLAKIVPDVSITLPADIIPGQTILSLKAILTQNAEYTGILKEKDFALKEDALAVSFAAFGTFNIIQKRVDGDDWSWPTFLTTMAHEVAHNLYFRLQFDKYPERINWRGLDHRFTYTIELAFLQAFMTSCPCTPAELKTIDDMIKMVKSEISKYNKQLNLPCDDFSIKLWDPSWEGKPDSFFMNDGDEIESIDDKEDIDLWLAGKSDKEIDALFVNEYKLAFAEMEEPLSASDQKIILDTIEELNVLKPEELSKTYTRPHPLAVWFGSSSLTYTGESWRNFKRSTMATTIYDIKKHEKVISLVLKKLVKKATELKWSAAQIESMKIRAEALLKTKNPEDKSHKFNLKDPLCILLLEKVDPKEKKESMQILNTGVSEAALIEHLINFFGVEEPGEINTCEMQP